MPRQHPSRPVRPRPAAAPPQPAIPPRRPGNEDRVWAAGAHLGGVVLGFIPPLVAYAYGLSRHASFVRDQAAEAVNFQLSLLAQVFGSALLLAIVAHVLPPVATLVLVIGYFLALLLLMFYVPVQAIRATLAVSRGTAFRYPATIRLVK